MLETWLNNGKNSSNQPQCNARSNIFSKDRRHTSNTSVKIICEHWNCSPQSK